jgi:hypothetical protein
MLAKCQVEEQFIFVTVVFHGKTNHYMYYGVASGAQTSEILVA